MVDLPSDTTDKNDAASEPTAAAAAEKAKTAATLPDALEKVLTRIDGADSILVALSKDPSVDEMAAAIALTMILDNSGKHATAIYSGATPNALEFLKPEDTFEPNTNSLQDFIIALNKEKADHLRYKIEGDFVKVYITPYRTTLTEKDLEFEHGDFNVDLVVALDVPSGEDLDAALSEYGRIMHDATAINITTGEPGRFAEIEWNDPEASSVCEMVVKLQSAMKDKAGLLDEQVATALLTGIVAATERFSNDKTSPKTMEVASRLMGAGADQKLISSNLTKSGVKKSAAEEEIENLQKEPGSLDVKHGDEETEEAPVAEETPAEEAPVPEEAPAEEAAPALESAPVLEPTSAPESAPTAPVVEAEPVAETAPVVDPTAEVTAEPTPQEQLDQVIQPLNGAPALEPAPALEAAPEVAVPAGDVVAAPEVPQAPVNAAAVYGSATTAPFSDTPILSAPDAVSMDSSASSVSGGPSLAGSSVLIDRDKDYGKMMDEELAEPAPAPQPMQPVADIAAGENPAAVAAPTVLTEPEAAPVSEAPSDATTGNAILPPPPAPPIDPAALTPTEVPSSLGSAPEMQATQTPASEPVQPAGVPDANAVDTGAFQIPQM